MRLSPAGQVRGPLPTYRWCHGYEVTHQRNCQHRSGSGRARGLGAFTVLVIGGLSQPLVGHVVPGLGAVWLPVVAVTAFAVAGARVGAANRPAAHGALAAVCGYLLVLPLLLTDGTFTAAEAAQTGLVSRVVPDEHVAEQALAVAERLAAGPTDAWSVGPPSSDL